MAALSAVSLSCSGRGASYPPNAVSIWCTKDAEDCGQQARQICPAGYGVINRETWTPVLVSWYRAPPRPTTTHEKIVIACEMPTGT